MKIDVLVCTKNSERLLEECLRSIYREIPLCHLLIIDDYSKDRTLEILDIFNKNYGNIKIISDEAKLGKARQIGIENVDTEWFAFIDSDVILPKRWWEEIYQSVFNRDSQLGAVESNVLHHYPENTPKVPEFRQIVKNKRIDPRALTIATVIKTEAVNKIKIPPDLAIYEDEFLKKYIEQKGFSWKKMIKPTVDHYPNPKPFKDAYLTGVYSIRYGLFPAWRIIIISLIFPIKYAYMFYVTRSFKASQNSVAINFYMLKGLMEEVFGSAKRKDI